MWEVQKRKVADIGSITAITYVSQTDHHLHIHEHIGISFITVNQIKTASSIYKHI